MDSPFSIDGKVDQDLLLSTPPPNFVALPKEGEAAADQLRTPAAKVAPRRRQALAAAAVVSNVGHAIHPVLGTPLPPAAVDLDDDDENAGPGVQSLCAKSQGKGAFGRKVGLAFCANVGLTPTHARL